MNTTTVGGIIKSDVILRYTKSKKPVLNMLVQTSDTCKNASGELHIKKNMHNIKFWDDIAVTVAKEYIREDFILLTGRSETRKKGESYDTEVIAEKLESSTNLVSINIKGEHNECSNIH